MYQMLSMFQRPNKNVYPFGTFLYSDDHFDITFYLDGHEESIKKVTLVLSSKLPNKPRSQQRKGHSCTMQLRHVHTIQFPYNIYIYTLLD